MARETQAKVILAIIIAFFAVRISLVVKEMIMMSSSGDVGGRPVATATTTLPPQVNVRFATFTPGPTEFPSGNWSWYQVQAGDTLSGIASRFNMPLTELARINGITNLQSLRIGQWLKIPAPATPTP